MNRSSVYRPVIYPAQGRCDLFVSDRSSSPTCCTYAQCSHGLRPNLHMPMSGVLALHLQPGDDAYYACQIENSCMHVHATVVRSLFYRGLYANVKLDVFSGTTSPAESRSSQAAVFQRDANAPRFSQGCWALERNGLWTP